MTEKDKNILKVDICGRLPYGTICEDIYGNSGILFDLIPELNSVTLKISKSGSTWTTDIDKIKPYLRPMSSMTEEEYSEFLNTQKMECGDGSHPHYEYTYKTFDWLNAHHFDYRGLIEKGLALPAPKEMYNTKTK